MSIILRGSSTSVLMKGRQIKCHQLVNTTRSKSNTRTCDDFREGAVRQEAADLRVHTYSLWEYVEVLHVQNDLDDYKGDQFGASVSVLNETSLFLVIGAPYDNDGGREAGAVIVTCLLPMDDLWSSWNPNDASGNHHRHLQGGGGGGGGGGAPAQGGEGAPAQGEPPDHSQNIWNIRSSQYTTDKDGSFWMTMTKELGSYAKEMYGYRTAISAQHLLVGTNAGPLSRGRVELLVLNTSSYSHLQSPVYKGPLYQKEWLFESALFDYNGGQGDYFGSALAISEETALIGGYLTGFKDSFDVGTGGAYIYDAYVVTVTETSSASSHSDTSSGGSFFSGPGSAVSLALFLAVVVVGVAVVSVQSSRWTLSLPSFFGAGGTDGRRKDLDSSVSSVDTVDMDSRHPLTLAPSTRHPQKMKPKPDSSYSRPTSPPALEGRPAPGGGKGKYRDPQPNKYSSRPPASRDEEEEEEEVAPPPLSRVSRAAVAQAESAAESPSPRQFPSKGSKTARYLQASSSGAAYGKPKSTPLTDSDSDSDHSAPAPPLPRPQQTSHHRR
jgi:hypothetical protein